MGVEDEVAHHVEGGFGLVCGHHMSGFVDKDKPKIFVYFSPSMYLSMDLPDLFFLLFPVLNSDPIQRIKEIKNPWCVNDIILLPIIVHDSNVLF